MVIFKLWDISPLFLFFPLVYEYVNLDWLFCYFFSVYRSFFVILCSLCLLAFSAIIGSSPLDVSFQWCLYSWVTIVVNIFCWYCIAEAYLPCTLLRNAFVGENCYRGFSYLFLISTVQPFSFRSLVCFCPAVPFSLSGHIVFHFCYGRKPYCCLSTIVFWVFIPFVISDLLGFMSYLCAFLSAFSLHFGTSED